MVFCIPVLDEQLLIFNDLLVSHDDDLLPGELLNLSQNVEHLLGVHFLEVLGQQLLLLIDQFL